MEPNFCSWVTRKSYFFVIEIINWASRISHVYSWAPLNFSSSTALVLLLIDYMFIVQVHCTDQSLKLNCWKQTDSLILKFLIWFLFLEKIKWYFFWIGSMKFVWKLMIWMTIYSGDVIIWWHFILNILFILLDSFDYGQHVRKYSRLVT